LPGRKEVRKKKMSEWKEKKEGDKSCRRTSLPAIKKLFFGSKKICPLSLRQFFFILLIKKG
jgi:hypothetical protein